MRSCSVLSACCLGACLLAPLPAHATLLPGYSTGNGSRIATLIVDFDFIGGDAYLFEYRFEGDVKAEQMLLDLDAAGGLTVHHQYFVFDGVSSMYVNGFSFDGNTAVPSFEGASGENWSYWLVDRRVAAPGFWTNSLNGPTDRVLEDNAYDGWSLNVSPFNSQGFEPTYDWPAVPGQPGDHDGDGDIDGVDLGLLFGQFTGPGEAQKTSLHGDYDRDGDVDGVDVSGAFALFTGPVAPVPEPAGAALLLISGIALTRRPIQR